MRYTSAETAKILTGLKNLHSAIENKERKSCKFVAAVGENLELARPEYSFEETEERLKQLEKKIRQIKHILNIFNATTVVPGFDMTIDEMLVYIPQLSRRKEELEQMAGQLPRERVQNTGRTSPVIEYTYANYDVKKAEEEYRKIEEELSRAQTALDTLNNTTALELENFSEE